MRITDDFEAMGDQIAETAATIDAATHELLSQIRAFDERGGWHWAGALSCAHWLNWRVGMSLGVAREKVRVAKALASLPLIDEALRKAEVSYSKVRAMTRVATPALEDELLNIARHTTASQLERVCRLYRQVTELDGETARETEDRRWVSQRGTGDGMVAVTLRLHRDEAATFMEALRVSAETCEGDLADGAVAMAEDALRGSSPDRTPVDVSLHVSAETLAGHLDDGTGVSAETCRRLCCDAGIAPIVEDADGTVLSVGRKTRTVPAPMKRALKARQPGCQFPGCTHTRYVDAHHIEHWAHGGETSLGNLVLLCRRHHRYVHEYGFDIVVRDGEVVFLDPGGKVLPPTGVPKAVCYDHRERFARSKWANMPQWDGVAPQYEYIVNGLANVAAAS